MVKNCKKGWPCGNSCISKKRVCRKKLQGKQSKQLAATYGDYVKALSGGGGGSEESAKQSSNWSAMENIRKDSNGNLQPTIEQVVEAFNRIPKELRESVISRDKEIYASGNPAGMENGLTQYADTRRPELRDRPTLVSNEEVQENTKLSGFRGDKTEDFYNQIARAEKGYIGRGLEGNGTYVAIPNEEEIGDLDDARVVAQTVAQSYAGVSNNEGVVYEVGYSKDAVGFNFNQTYSMITAGGELDQAVDAQTAQQIRDLDISVLAAEMGADYLVTSSSDAEGEYHTLGINRSKLVVGDRPLTQYVSKNHDPYGFPDEDEPIYVDKETYISQEG